MGIDAMIFFASNNKFPDLFCEYKSISKEEWPPLKQYGGYPLVGPLFQVMTNERYYEKGYERGNWPQIAAIIMELFSCPDVDRVWYCGDDYLEEKDLMELAPSRVARINKHYMRNGNRPYYEKRNA